MKNKKNGKAFKNFFKNIYKVIDKLIVTPISTLVYKIQSRLGKDNKLEKILNRPNVLLYISLVFAVLIFFIVDGKATQLVGNNAEFLTDIPVRVIYNSSAYVIEGVPETVDMTLIGRKGDLYLARQLGDNEVVLNLENYDANDGTVRVKVTYNKIINNIDYKIDPEYITVKIKEKVSENKTVVYDLLNQDGLDPKLSVKSVTLSKSDVIVRGSKENIDNIASIKALVDLSNEDFVKAGSYNVDNLKLVAYGSNGELITNVEIVATNISATVVLDSNSKKVPVRIQTTGSLVSGKAISSITINGKNATEFETTIYGDEEALANVDYLNVSIDINQLGNSGSKTSSVTFPKPSGVRYIENESVTLVLNFGEAKQRTITIKRINTRNTPNGLTANLLEEEDETVDVQVIGVESVINSIDESSITAYVDLTGYSAGKYSIPVKVEGTDSRLQYVVSKNIQIVLSKARD
ncbi:MAG: hypothetical protein IKP07_03750 [Bacilli bacterium]|jgi:YbbR domain-containing protein|nr:hypothetical protein [Bacilli bacterium]